MRAFLLLAFSVPTLLHAQPGALDPEFGTDGTAITMVGQIVDYVTDLAVQPDGKLVVAGYTQVVNLHQFAVARFNSNGMLDNSFSGNGEMIVSGTQQNECHAMALQPDGKILLAGWGNVGFTRDFVVVRLNPDGSMDTSFDGDGRVSTPVTNTTDEAYAIAVQPDGKIVVAGFAEIATLDNFAVVRYNPDGTLDTGFNGTGMLVVPVGTADNVAQDLALQPDGRIVVAGYAGNGTDKDVALVRVMPDGTLDTGFGVNGILTSPLGDDDDEANAVAIQADGRIVVAGYTDGDGVDFAVLRYEPGGTLDPGFAVGGIAITDVSGPYDQAEDVVIQADGAILVGGYTYNGTDGDFGLVRYTANGELDPSFGDAGIVRTSIADGSHDAGTCLAVQPDARIVMAGHTDAIPYQATAVVRYLSGLNLGSLETNSTASEVLVYPLPVVDEAVLEYELARASMLSCSLLDAQGRTARVFSSRTSRAAGRHAERLDLSGLVAGPYTLLIDGTSGKSTVRLVKR